MCLSFRLVTSTYSLTLNTTGMMPGESVSCTGAGWCRSMTCRSSTASWGTASRSRLTIGTGPMAMTLVDLVFGHMHMTIQIYHFFHQELGVLVMIIRLAAPLEEKLLPFTLATMCNTGVTTVIWCQVLGTISFAKLQFECLYYCK